MSKYQIGAFDQQHFIKALDRLGGIDYPIKKDALVKRAKNVELKFTFPENTKIYPDLAAVIAEFEPKEFVSGTALMQSYVRWTGQVS